MLSRQCIPLPLLKSRCSGVDYTVDSSLSFNVPVMASGGRYCIDLSTVDDNIAEGNEQFQLAFDSTGSANEGNPAVLCVDIADYDDGMKPWISSAILSTNTVKQLAMLNIHIHYMPACIYYILLLNLAYTCSNSYYNIA